MTKLRILMLLLVLVLTGGRAEAALFGGDKKAFEVAAESFRLQQWERAERELADFVRDHGGSERVAEAVWLQAQAQYQQRQFAAAAGLLEARLAAAGDWLAPYLYWLGQAQLAGTNFTGAAAAFGRLAREFPAGTNRLEAAVNEAVAWSQAGDWARVVGLLRQADGPFRLAAVAEESDWSARGFLLLAEAQFRLEKYPDAQAALNRMGTNLSPRVSWQRAQLSCQVQLAAGRREEALTESLQLIAAAEQLGPADRVAEAVEFRAGLLAEAGRRDEMIATLRRNLTNVPVARQRAALWRIAAAELAADRVAEAMQLLLPVTLQTNHGAADVALVVLGELELKQQVRAPARPGETNHLAQATNYLLRLVQEFPQSGYLGKAYLNLGWAHWLAGEVGAGEAAFAEAASRLANSPDLAVARFKWADAQFARQNFAGALTNYQAALTVASNWPAVARELGAAAGYQMLRASLALTNVGSAEQSVPMLLANEGVAAATPEGVLLVTQSYLEEGRFQAAEELFAEFGARFPNSALRPEAELLRLRMQEEQGAWGAVATNYTAWLAAYPQSSLRAEVEFRRALALARSGDETNAWQLVTNFVAQHSQHELAPLAQWWVADWHYQQRRYLEAEIAYKQLFNNWPGAPLAYRARLMAGHAARGRSDYNEAIEHFIGLTSDTNCPVELRMQALFARGGALQLSGAGTNRLAALAEARKVFREVLNLQPGPEPAALAWGEMGNCCLQMAAADPSYYGLASNAYQQAFSVAAASVAVRGQALFGLAQVLEKQAGAATNGLRSELLKLARDFYLDGYLGKRWPEAASDPYWKKQSGWEAARISEGLGDWAQAAELYRDLARQRLFAEDLLEKRIAAVEKQVRPME